MPRDLQNGSTRGGEVSFDFVPFGDETFEAINSPRAIRCKSLLNRNERAGK
jgi:hypothetical protein